MESEEVELRQFFMNSSGWFGSDAVGICHWISSQFNELLSAVAVLLCELRELGELGEWGVLRGLGGLSESSDDVSEEWSIISSEDLVRGYIFYRGIENVSKKTVILNAKS